MFWESELYNRIVRQLSRVTAYDIFGLTRDECTFTKSLACYFNPSFVGDACACLFLRAIVNKLIDKSGVREGVLGDLRERLSSDGYAVNRISTELECPIRVQYNHGHFSGYIDLRIDIRIVSADNPRDEEQFRIVVENKVYSQEHRLGQHEEGPWQTEGYKIWGDQFQEVRTCYVFLAPDDRVACHCTDYVRLNYQDIVDAFGPLVAHIPNERTDVKRLLDDFMHVLGASLIEPERQIMAIAQDDRDRIQRFWMDNRDELLSLLDIIEQTQRVEIPEEDRRRIQAVRNRRMTNIIFRIGDRDVSEEEFRSEFLRVGQADRILTYEDDHEEHKPWNLHNLGEGANIRGNVQSQGWWRDRRQTGLVSVVCKICV